MGDVGIEEKGEERVRCECVTLLNIMMLYNHTPCSFCLSVTYMQHTCTHALTLAWPFCQGDSEGRAERDAGEKVIETLKTKVGGHETLFTPCSPFSLVLSFSASVLIFYLSCMFWMLRCDCKVACLETWKRNTLPSFGDYC